MYYVYVIKSQKTNKLYFGFSNNLKRRLQEHNAGKSNYTRRFRPWDLIYYEAYAIEQIARNREEQLKHHGRVYTQLKKRILHEG